MIELSRNITFGQYINNGSSLARMDPRAKLLCAILLIATISLVSKFLAFAVLLLFCILLQRASHISIAYALRGFKPFLGFLAFIYVIQVIFYASPDQHQTIYWQWWILNISKEGILNSTLVMIRALFLYYLVSMLMFTTSMVDFTDGLEALLSPLQRLRIPVNAFVMVLVIALKFVPIFVQEVERLVKAQAARGVRFDQGNVIQRILKLAPLFIPLFVSGFKRAQTLSVAMEARCYGNHAGWRRSKRRQMHFKRFDTLTLLTTIVICAAMLAASFFTPI
ncbi:MAG: energy-coupling factor transporter transmembrane protein EcfT [Ktedonobacteraceae bacterium]|nr:energy-coupling factor transporter transmembrane protein EcfT [Ktedonobacteraceae bacterium]